MSDVFKTFSKQLLNLNKTLSKRFPENKELSLGVTAIETIIYNNNSKKLAEMFVLYVYKYKDDVMNKNEQFLLDKDYLENDNKTKENINIIDNLKKNWKMLKNEEKEPIWQYLQVLMVLIEKYLKQTITT